MINVLLVDDNGPIRKNVRSLIRKADDIQVLASATNGVEAVEKARLLRPDVAVMDISMPLMDGLEATAHIRECCRLTRVVILSGFDTPHYVERGLEVGAKGYVLKDVAAEDLVEAIRSVYQGNYFFSAQISEIAEKHLARKGNESSRV